MKDTIYNISVISGDIIWKNVKSELYEDILDIIYAISYSSSSIGIIFNDLSRSNL